MRSIGSDLRMDYTAVGQTTHLAARMEQLAAPGSILLAPDTLQLAEGYVQVQALGPMPVKGLERAGRGRTSCSARARRARGSRRPRRAGLTRFVGRDAELETLRRTLEQAGAGHGQVVALVGEPGVGQVAAGLGVQPLAPHAGLAGAGERLGLLRQGDRPTCR